MAGIEVRKLESDSEILASYEVMSQLRPQVPREEYLPRVRRQISQGYCLAASFEQGKLVCVAGYRFGENLAWGRYLYVDDLVTDESSRSTGHGKALLDWLIQEARKQNCDQLHLDSGTQRTQAHRFYLRQRMAITSFHFALKLK